MIIKKNCQNMILDIIISSFNYSVRMSNTTTPAVTEASTTISPLDWFLSLIQIPSITIQFFLWGYLVTFILGFIGNTLSLLTFSRATLRNISTGCLFILLAISDTLYLLVAVIDFVEFGLQVVYSK